MILLTEVQEIESRLFNGMTQTESISIIALISLLALIPIAAIIFAIKAKIDENHYVWEEVEDKEFEYDNFIAFPCPCCRSTKIQLLVNVSFPRISCRKRKIGFDINSTYLTYKIKCKECGIQTEYSRGICSTIMDWNGKSQSTEIVKKDDI